VAFFKLRKTFFEDKIDDTKYLGHLYGLGAPHSRPSGSSGANGSVIVQNGNVRFFFFTCFYFSTLFFFFVLFSFLFFYFFPYLFILFYFIIKTNGYETYPNTYNSFASSYSYSNQNQNLNSSGVNPNVGYGGMMSFASSPYNNSDS